MVNIDTGMLVRLMPPKLRRWLVVVQTVRQRPLQLGPPGPAHIAVHSVKVDPQALGNYSLRQTLSKVQPQNLSYVPHRRSLTWHPHPLLLGRGEATLGW